MLSMDIFFFMTGNENETQRRVIHPQFGLNWRIEETRKEKKTHAELTQCIGFVQNILNRLNILDIFHRKRLRFTKELSVETMICINIWLILLFLVPFESMVCHISPVYSENVVCNCNQNVFENFFSPFFSHRPCFAVINRYCMCTHMSVVRGKCRFTQHC